MLTGVGVITWGGSGVHRVTERMMGENSILVRYQGGNDTGYALKNESGSFQFSLLPPEIRRPGTVCVLGDGMVVDPDYLRHEISMMNYFHIPVTPDNLKLSSRAAVCLPLHVREDVLAEQYYHKDHAFPPVGVSYAYADSLNLSGITLGDLLSLDQPSVQYRIRSLLAGKNHRMTRIYDQSSIELSETMDWCREQAKYFAPFICDTGAYLQKADEEGASIFFESPRGALLDMTYGFYPHTACYHTLLGYAPISAGLPGKNLDHAVGVLSAYSSVPGNSLFVAEKADEKWNEQLSKKISHENTDAFGTLETKVSYGPFDAVASRYGIRCQNPDTIVLTGLNVLSGFSVIPAVTGYRINGKTISQLSALDTGAVLEEAEPVTAELPGWNEDLSGCGSYDALPEKAKKYIAFIEESIGKEISIIESCEDVWLYKPQREN